MTKKLADEFGFVPHWFRRQAVQIYDLSLVQQTVYLVLCDHADDRRITFCATRDIASQGNIARSGVAPAIARLLEIGLIELVREGNAYEAPHFRLVDKLPMPEKVYPLPTRRARHEGSRWVAVDPEEGDSPGPMTLPGGGIPLDR